MQWIVICFFVLLAGCGGGGGGSNPAVVTASITYPSISGSSASVSVATSKASVSTSSTVSAATNVATATINSCSLSAAGLGGTTTESFTFNSSGNTVKINALAGFDKTFSATCSDTSETTRGIDVGYFATKTIDFFRDTTTSITGQYLNLASDASDTLSFARINQENGTQTKITLGFGSTLTAAQKNALRCIWEWDNSANRTSLGVIDVANSNGLTTGTKSGPYILITGGTDRPDAFFYNSSGTQTMRMNPSWSTHSGGTTAVMTFGITQMKNIIDSNEAGQFAVACSLTGTTPYDLAPDSGYAQFNLSGNTNTSDVASLISNGASCSTARNGETCTSGFCVGSGICTALTAQNINSSNAVVTNLAGPAAGTTTAGSSNGTGSAASFDTPLDNCLTPDGTKLFVMDRANNAVRQIVVATTVVTTLASGGTITAPQGCAVDPAGTLVYITNGDNRILTITISGGTVAVFAGQQDPGSTNGTGTSASFNGPFGLTFNASGDTLYIADRDNAIIRKSTVPGAVVTTLAGTAGSTGTTDGTGSSARFNTPNFIAIDSTGTNLYLTDDGNNRIRKIVAASGVVTTLAGTGTAGSADNVVGTSATFSEPAGIKIDPTDSLLYVNNMAGHTIRKIELSGTNTVTTIAGAAGSASDTNGTGTAARFSSPTGLAISPTGATLYIAEQTNNKIRQINLP